MGTPSLALIKVPPYSASAAEDRTIFMILQRTYIGPLRGGSLFFWDFGGVRREAEETVDTAAGIANRCKRRVRIDPETHVAGDVPNAGIGESGDKVEEFFCRGS